MAVQHGTITGDAVHVPYAGSFANAAARTGATGLDSTQHGKLFRQLDDNSLWMLVNTSPLTWKPLTPDKVASAEYADNAGYANNAGTLNGKAEGSLSVNYANSAGSVSDIGGARGKGRCEYRIGDGAYLYAPSGGQWIVLYNQSMSTGMGGSFSLSAGKIYAGGAQVQKTGYSDTGPSTFGDFYRIG